MSYISVSFNKLRPYKSYFDNFVVPYEIVLAELILSQYVPVVKVGKYYWPGEIAACFLPRN